jgi:hypothetical protein
MRAAQQRQGRRTERLRPEILQQVVVKERESDLLLLERSHRWRDGDLPGRPGLEDEPVGPDVLQIEQLEEAVDDIDPLRVALDVEVQRVLERENLLGAEAEDALALQLQLVRQPLHLGPVGGGLVAHHEGDHRIAHRRAQRGQRGVETGDHLVAGAQDRAGTVRAP